MTQEFLIAGFGGQGLLFAGKFLVNLGMKMGKQVTWLPSYGPEMRGGTANCSVILSDDPVGSPIVDSPNILMVMNLPSLDKYERAVTPGGMIAMDSSLINRQVTRADTDVVSIPATQLASDNQLNGLANMILMGGILEKLGLYDETLVNEAIAKVTSVKHPELGEANRKALEMGRACVRAEN